VTNLCRWIHEQLERLPLFKYPFNLEDLPKCGIYFFYEEGEIWGHGGDKPRIVRIGTHRGNNFRNRLKEHYLLNDQWMNFDIKKSRPHDRSIFRKNIGRALLNKWGDSYIKIWNIDFIPKANREKYKNSRDISKEKKIEEEVTKVIRELFSFRFIIVEDQFKRIGSKGLECVLIGTVSSCELCKPSDNWLGNYSPLSHISNSGLWLTQHLNSEEICERNQEILLKAIEETKSWNKQK